MSKNDESSGLCDMEDMEFHFQPQCPVLSLSICDGRIVPSGVSMGPAAEDAEGSGE